MRLIECYIENFGKLSEKRIAFTEGLNAIREDNGFGKTTLAVFIKVMLFGMSDTKKAQLDENERRHYLPWSGGRCGGSLTIEVGKKRYRIEREFGKRASLDSFSLYDLTLGRRSDDYSSAIGEELFGIDGDGFERTVFFSERALLPERGHERISAKLGDLSDTEDDMRDLEDALSVLEEQRKYYLKKGGGGEIAELEGQINALTVRLTRLTEIEKRRKDSEERLGRLSVEISEERARRSEILDKKEEAAVSSRGGGFEARYGELKRQLDGNEGRLRELIEFFGGSVPTHAEIDECAFKLNEAEKLRDGSRIRMSAEHRRLSDYFGDRVSDSEVDSAETALKAVKGCLGKKSISSEARERAGALLSELRATEPPKFGAGASLPLLLFGILLIVGGVVLGYFASAYIYAAAGVGALLFAVGAALLPSRKKSKKYRKVRTRVAKFLNSELETTVPESEMETRLSEISESDGDSADEHMRVIYDFIGRFPPTDEPDAVSMAESVIGMYRELVRFEEAEDEARESFERSAEEKVAEANAFLSRFSVDGSDPIGEIRRAVAEYEYVDKSIRERKSALADFALLHGIGDRGGENAFSEELRASDGRIASLEREYAVTEKQYEADGEALEEREEISASREMLSDRLSQLKAELSVVQATARLLTEARENMTAKYLGRMRESFEKYRRLLGDAAGCDFMLDTTFSLSLIDGGVARQVDAYSRGSRDLYRIVTRLALIDAMYERESPPIILDDPFTALDDSRVSLATELIGILSRDRQMIYLTCSESRMPRRK